MVCPLDPGKMRVHSFPFSIELFPSLIRHFLLRVDFTLSSAPFFIRRSRLLDRVRITTLEKVASDSLCRPSICALGQKHSPFDRDTRFATGRWAFPLSEGRLDLGSIRITLPYVLIASNELTMNFKIA